VSRRALGLPIPAWNVPRPTIDATTVSVLAAGTTWHLHATATAAAGGGCWGFRQRTTKPPSCATIGLFTNASSQRVSSATILYPSSESAKAITTATAKTPVESHARCTHWHAIWKHERERKEEGKGGVPSDVGNECRSFCSQARRRCIACRFSMLISGASSSSDRTIAQSRSYRAISDMGTPIIAKYLTRCRFQSATQ
jgi:hypothetical protein